MTGHRSGGMAPLADARLELLVRLPDRLPVRLFPPVVPVPSEEPGSFPVEEEKRAACVVTKHSCVVLGRHRTAQVLLTLLLVKVSREGAPGLSNYNVKQR